MQKKRRRKKKKQQKKRKVVDKEERRGRRRRKTTKRQRRRRKKIFTHREIEKGEPTFSPNRPNIQIEIKPFQKWIELKITRINSPLLILCEKKGRKGSLEAKLATVIVLLMRGRMVAFIVL